jgi:predicted CoA-binding protein
MNVAVVGASNNPERYSHQAVLMLREQGHVPYPVHPSIDEVAGLAVYEAVNVIPAPIDTVSVYVSGRNQKVLADDLLKSGVRRVIFNPGAENAEVEGQLREAGVEVVEACTLVLLRTGQF